MLSVGSEYPYPTMTLKSPVLYAAKPCKLPSPFCRSMAVRERLGRMEKLSHLRNEKSPRSPFCTPGGDSPTREVRDRRHRLFDYERSKRQKCSRGRKVDILVLLLSCLSKYPMKTGYRRLRLSTLHRHHLQMVHPCFSSGYSPTRDLKWQKNRHSLAPRLRTPGVINMLARLERQLTGIRVYMLISESERTCIARSLYLPARVVDSMLHLSLRSNRSLTKEYSFVRSLPQTDGRWHLKPKKKTPSERTPGPALLPQLWHPPQAFNAEDSLHLPRRSVYAYEFILAICAGKRLAGRTVRRS